MKASRSWRHNQSYRVGQLRASATATHRKVVSKPNRMPENQLEVLQRMSKVVADTGVYASTLSCISCWSNRVHLPVALPSGGVIMHTSP